VWPPVARASATKSLQQLQLHLPCNSCNCNCTSRATQWQPPPEASAQSVPPHLGGGQASSV
jgi:hypothetical protein